MKRVNKTLDAMNNKLKNDISPYLKLGTETRTHTTEKMYWLRNIIQIINIIAVNIKKCIVFYYLYTY